MMQGTSPPAPPRMPGLSLVGVPPDSPSPFYATFHVEEMVQIEINEELEHETGATPLVPGQVIAVVTVRHDGEMEVEQVSSPWTFKDTAALTEFGALLYQARELAEIQLGPNWTGPKKVVLL